MSSGDHQRSKVTRSFRNGQRLESEIFLVNSDFEEPPEEFVVIVYFFFKVLLVLYDPYDYYDT